MDSNQIIAHQQRPSKDALWVVVVVVIVVVILYWQNDKTH